MSKKTKGEERSVQAQLEELQEQNAKQCMDEVNAVLKKHGMTLATAPVNIVLVPER